MAKPNIAAALVENLDLVITVDTSMGHLAGAMARPVWIMVPKAADWRWMLEREDTPWYPTARLFRQAKPGEWDPVLQPGHRRAVRRTTAAVRRQLIRWCATPEFWADAGRWFDRAWYLIRNPDVVAGRHRSVGALSAIWRG